MSSSSNQKSSSSSGWVNRGWRLGRGMPKSCRCGEASTIKTSGTSKNPGRLFHCCPHGSENDNYHLFRWTDECMVEEIDDLKPQVSELVGKMRALEKSMEACEAEVCDIELVTRTCEAVVGCYDEKIDVVKGVLEKEIEAMKGMVRSAEKEIQECKDEIRSLKNITVCGFVFVSVLVYYYVFA